MFTIDFLEFQYKQKSFDYMYVGYYRASKVLENILQKYLNS